MNDSVGWSDIITKGNLTSVFYLDVDKLTELGLTINELWPVIKQVLRKYFGDNADMSFYLLKNVSSYRCHIYFYKIIVSKQTGYGLICEVNKRMSTTKAAVDPLNLYSNTLRFEGCYKWDKDTGSFSTNTNYILIRGSLLNNQVFYNNIFNYGSEETQLVKSLPTPVVVSSKKEKRKSSRNTGNKQSYSTTAILDQVLAPSIENKLTVEIRCKEDILSCIPNTNEFYQTYTVWWSIGIACKRIGISRQTFEQWTGNTAKRWDTWEVYAKS